MDEPVMPGVTMNLVKPGAPVIGTVISNTLCMRGKSASYVKHLVVDVSGTPLAGNFRAGQSFGVLPPGTDALGKPYKVRLYSIACPTWGEDGDARVLSTTPKRLIEEFAPQSEADDASRHDLFLGVCSNYLCDLSPGDQVQLTGPNGKRFLLPADPHAHDYLFVATGTGIAPFRGMLLELLEHPDGPCNSRIALIMGSPYSTDLLYDDLFRRLDSEHENFTYHTAISREPGSADAGRYVHDLLANALDAFAPMLTNPRTLIYLCGLTGMRTGLYRTLIEHDLHTGYVNVSDALLEKPAERWSAADVRRGIKPTGRCLIEVY